MGMEPAGAAPSGSIPGRKLPRLIKPLAPSPRIAPERLGHAVDAAAGFGEHGHVRVVNIESAAGIMP